MKKNESVTIFRGENWEGETVFHFLTGEKREELVKEYEGENGGGDWDEYLRDYLFSVVGEFPWEWVGEGKVVVEEGEEV